MRKQISIVLWMLAITVLSNPFGTQAQERGEDDRTVITVVASDVDSGVSGGTVTRGSGASGGVKYTIGSTVRYIDKPWGTDRVDNLSFTSVFPANGGPFIDFKAVRAGIWKNGALANTSPSAVGNFQGTVSVKTLEINVPGRFRGTGEHWYGTRGKKLLLPGTDTGWRQIN